MNYGDVVIRIVSDGVITDLALDFNLSDDTVKVSHLISDYECSNQYMVDFEHCGEDLIDVLKRSKESV